MTNQNPIYLTKMDNKESHMYMSWCNHYGIKIYPVPQNNLGIYKIQIDRNGKKSTGKLEFSNKPKQNENSIWDQIRELYKIIYEKEINQNE